MFGWYQRNADPAPLFYNGEENRSVNSRFRWASPETWMSINNFCNGSQIINCNNVSQPYGFHPGGILVSDSPSPQAVFTERRSGDWHLREDGTIVNQREGLGHRVGDAAALAYSDKGKAIETAVRVNGFNVVSATPWLIARQV